jgi:hypothetical protein
MLIRQMTRIVPPDPLLPLAIRLLIKIGYQNMQSDKMLLITTFR